MLVCKECKSDNVDVMACVNINTSEYQCDVDSQAYCNECQDEVSVEDK